MIIYQQWRIPLRPLVRCPLPRQRASAFLTRAIQLRNRPMCFCCLCKASDNWSNRTKCKSCYFCSYCVLVLRHHHHHDHHLHTPSCPIPRPPANRQKATQWCLFRPSLHLATPPTNRWLITENHSSSSTSLNRLIDIPPVCLLLVGVVSRRWAA